jgi:hypothetical protein
METDLGSMHWSQPLIATWKRENMMSYSNSRYKKRCWEGKDAQVISRAYTRIGASTITIIIGWTKKCFGLAQPWWAS